MTNDAVKYFPGNALRLAIMAHDGQVRKYPVAGVVEPYIVHPIRVAGLVQCKGMVAIEAALLHDVIEDCDVTYDDLAFTFNVEVADLVRELTNTSKERKGFNRMQRKALDREHISKASPLAKTIKCADRYDNLRNIAWAPKDFAKTYLLESFALLEVLKDADFPGMFTKLEKRCFELSKNQNLGGDHGLSKRQT